MSQHLEKAIQDKQNLTYELDDIYALADTSRLALIAEGSDEAECVVRVLSIATEKLFFLIEKENKALKKLEAEKQGGDE